MTHTPVAHALNDMHLGLIEDLFSSNSAIDFWGVNVHRTRQKHKDEEFHGKGATQQLGMLQAEACQGKLNLSSAASTTSVI